MGRAGAATRTPAIRTRTCSARSRRRAAGVRQRHENGSDMRPDARAARGDCRARPSGCAAKRPLRRDAVERGRRRVDRAAAASRRTGRGGRAALRPRPRPGCGSATRSGRRPPSERVRQQVQRIEQLIERAQKRSAAEDLTLREADGWRAICDRDRRAAAGAEPRAQQALVERLKARARRRSRRSCTSCARWTSGSGSPTPPSRKS